MKFSVGYTIFNKKHLLPKIVFGINEAFNEADEIIFLFDDCTDGSIEEFQKLSGYLPSKPKIIIEHEDLYEIKANNRILRESSGDFTILFQDDIVNFDKALKNKVLDIAKHYKHNLGLMGGRSGYELTSNPTFPEKSYYRVSNWEHLDKQYGERLPDGAYAERTFLNRGPIVFSRDLINEVGYLDEEFYPLWGDDLDYCARAKFKFGKTNIVFECKVESQLGWGALRNSKRLFPSSEGLMTHNNIARKNWRLFMSRWGEAIKKAYANTA